MSSSMSSSELDGMIYGMLLGDGCIRKPTKAGTCNFILHHSAKQEEYILHKLELLKKISHIKTNFWLRETFNKKQQKTYKSIYAQTNFLNYFVKLRNIFYKEGTKRVNQKILDKLTPLGLALWWMDDGCFYINAKRTSKNSHIERRAYLATCSFTQEEHELIKKYFQNTWSIRISIRQHPTTKYYTVSFPIPEFEKFIEIIKPYIIPSMFYKINIRRELDVKPGPKVLR